MFRIKFYPFEVVGRGNETQLHVGRKFKLYNLAVKGLSLIDTVVGVIKENESLSRQKKHGLNTLLSPPTHLGLVQTNPVY